MGRQFEVLEYILSFKYKAADDEDVNRLQEMLLNSDKIGNTPLHYAYALNEPKMRDILRAYEPKMKQFLAKK